MSVFFTEQTENSMEKVQNRGCLARPFAVLRVIGQYPSRLCKDKRIEALF